MLTNNISGKKKTCQRPANGANDMPIVPTTC
jgi:hypothetical protein